MPETPSCVLAAPHLGKVIEGLEPRGSARLSCFALLRWHRLGRTSARSFEPSFAPPNHFDAGMPASRACRASVAAIFSRVKIFYDSVDPTRLNPKENEL
jgi:hypothetical protein